MVIIPFISLVVLNWRIHMAIKRREAFRATLSASNNANASRTQKAGPPPPQAGGGLTKTDANDQKGSKEREVTISQILVLIVIIFLVCQSFKVVVVGYEVFSHFNSDGGGNFPFWIEVVINLNHVALATNAAMNIAVYICKDTKFRKACIEMLPVWMRGGTRNKICM